MKLIFRIVLIVSFVQRSIQQNWCELTCDNGVPNTMCTYPNPNVPNMNECKDQKNAMTDAVKQKILGLHNYVRNHIAAGNVAGWPAAANMRQMSWDDEVAELALRWTLQCTAGHDKCRRTQIFHSPGQNWGYMAGTPFPGSEYPDGALDVFKLWLNEIDQASANIVDSFDFHHSTGHFTALVWAGTYKIGCGLVNSTFASQGRTFTRSTLTCNYAPGGNVGGSPIWQKGKPCTKCPPGTQCKPNSSYRNLCASPDDPIDEVPIPIDIGTADPQNFVPPSNQPSPEIPPSIQRDWCALTCDNGAPNTMCLYPNPHVPNMNECRDQKNAMTDTVKKKILGLHNYVRNHIAAGNVQGWPAAANMRQMSWDDEVAELALRWTLQCTAGHDKCRRTQIFHSIGQNWGYMAGTPSPGSEYPDGALDVFKLWLNEIDQASANIVDRFDFHHSTGHYTALVWAGTYKIGCGLVNSTFASQGHTFTRSTLTCNYAPGGNVPTSPIWERGNPCTKCPPGTQCKPNSSYPNLCASPDDPFDEVPIPIDIGSAGPRELVPPPTQRNWCALTCANGEQNTMCKYPNPHVTNMNECRDQRNAMTDAVKKKILGLHNYVRNHIAAGNVQGWPAAANMRQMSWDDDVAELALRWTLQCIAGHDKCRRTQNFDHTGQNWGYVSGVPGSDYPDGAFTVFKNWLNEIEKASASIVDKFSYHHSYGHYTAQVWAGTYKIGCGLVNSTSNEQGRTFTRSTMTCNYAPGGNAEGSPMWEKGNPCTKCPSGTQCKPNSSYRYLCAAPDDPIDEVPIPIIFGTASPKKFDSIWLILHAFPVILAASAMV